MSNTVPVRKQLGADIDTRGKRGRLLKQLYREFIDQVGGDEVSPPAMREIALAMAVAGTAVREQAARYAAGEDIDAELFTKQFNNVVRGAQTLRDFKIPKDLLGPSLAEETKRHAPPKDIEDAQTEVSDA